MNQRGEITLLASLLLLGLMGIILLASLELKRSYQILENRTHLFLCIKESKGELHGLMKYIGRVNWAIRNINNIRMIMMLFPGLESTTVSAKEVKKYLQKTQHIRIITYQGKLNHLVNKKCPLDKKMFLTPFKINKHNLIRDRSGAVTLREKEWSYQYLNHHFLIELKIHTKSWDGLKPQLLYTTKEKRVKFSSLWSSS